MKKVLCAILCFLLVFPAVVTFGTEYSGDDRLLSSNLKEFLDDYKSGKYGDELYYFSIANSKIIITVTDGCAFLTCTEPYYGRIMERQLTSEEYRKLANYVIENNVDSLPNCENVPTYDVSPSPSDNVPGYSYIHIASDDKLGYVYMKGLGFFADKDDSMYLGLVDLFKNLLASGDFELSYSSGAKIIIPREEHWISSVWKDGDDFRVCVETDEGLSWHSFKDGVVGEELPEPDGFTLTDAWNDVDYRWLYNQSINRYPLQCSWNGYRVRIYGGLYPPYKLQLCAEGQEPITIAEGHYSNPVVIPGTDFVVCTRKTYKDTIVKIDLNTFEETIIPFESTGSLRPEAMIGDKLLVNGGIGKRYLWDPVTDEISHVSGDFGSLLLSNDYRFLQQADSENIYYDVETDYQKKKAVVGILDLNEFSFVPLMTYEGIAFSNLEMWVDTENSTIYVAHNGDLLELPFSLATPYYEPIIVRYNGRRLRFTKDTIIGNGHIYVSDWLFGGTNLYNGNDQFISWGRKLLMLPDGADYMLELDASSFDSIKDLEADMANSDITQKSYYKVIPLGTTLPRWYVPLRAVCEAFGIDIVWNGEESCVEVTISESDTSNLTDSEIHVLMEILRGR